MTCSHVTRVEQYPLLHASGVLTRVFQTATEPALQRSLTERWVERIACIFSGLGLLPARRRPANSQRLAPTCKNTKPDQMHGLAAIRHGTDAGGLVWLSTHTWLLADERCAAGAGAIGRTMHGLFANMVAILTGRMGASGIRCRVRTQLAQPLGPCRKDEALCGPRGVKTTSLRASRVCDLLTAGRLFLMSCGKDAQHCAADMSHGFTRRRSTCIFIGMIPASYLADPVPADAHVLCMAVNSTHMVNICA